VGRTTFLPPVKGNKSPDDFLREIELWATEVHKNLFGLSDNDGEIGEPNAPGFHDGTVGNHEDMVQATDTGDATASTLSILEPDADVTYGAEEAALLNELKDKMNLHIAEYNVFISEYNSRQAADRTANQIG
jgi:hypothetical protein